MKKYFLLLLTVRVSALLSFAQSVDSLIIPETHYMIPMRDGMLLNTIVLTPVNQTYSASLLD